MSSKNNKKPLVIDLNRPHHCEFCKQTFAKESTLSTHVCESKRRWQQQNLSYVRKAFWAYKFWYQSLSPHKLVIKSYQEFASSNLYSAFVKFGAWCEQHQIQEFEALVKWLVAQNRGLPAWCDLNAYEVYLNDLLTTESSEQAVSRSLNTITAWAQETNHSFTQFFELCHPNIVINWIAQGKISAWLLYNSVSAVKFFERCSEEQLQIVQKTAPIKQWRIRFLRTAEQADAIKQTLEQAGL
jgi:hypothetical protein